jgi:type IV secretory pathway protease TraF
MDGTESVSPAPAPAASRPGAGKRGSLRNVERFLVRALWEILNAVLPALLITLGDNRPNSRDSRYFGPVPIDQIVGRAWLVCWPPENIKLIR